MNEKFNKNEKVEQFTTMLGIAVRLIVINPLKFHFKFQMQYERTCHKECTLRIRIGPASNITPHRRSLRVLSGEAMPLAYTVLLHVVCWHWD